MSRPSQLSALAGVLLVSAFLTACGGVASIQTDVGNNPTHNDPPQPPDLASESDDAKRVREETARIQSRIQHEHANASPKPAATSLGGEVQATTPPTSPMPLPAPACSPDTCAASEGICESSQTICQIAAKHPGEQEFEASCAWAQARCDEAKTRCKLCTSP